MNPYNSHISSAISSARQDEIARHAHGRIARSARVHSVGDRLYLVPELAPGFAAVLAAVLAVVIGAPLAA
jgi:hypothetical protein